VVCISSSTTSIPSKPQTTNASKSYTTKPTITPSPNSTHSPTAIASQPTATFASRLGFRV
jgi:hypothetical protein